MPVARSRIRATIPPLPVIRRRVAETLSARSSSSSARAAAGFFLPSRCLACAGRATWRSSSGAASAGPAGRPFRRATGRAAACCGETPAGRAAGRRSAAAACSIRPRSTALRGGALPRRGARDPARVQVPRRGLPRPAPGRRRCVRPPPARRNAAAKWPRCPRPARPPRPRIPPGRGPGGLALPRRLGIPFAAAPARKARETRGPEPRPARGARRQRAPRVPRPTRRPAGGVLLSTTWPPPGATARECARRLAEAGARRDHRVVLRARLARSTSSAEAA